MPVAQEVLDTIALSRDEYALIIERLGREPNEVELGMFGALWSEHCGYKNSKPLLRQLPGEGPYVLTQRAAATAGAVDIGDGVCVVLKIESHNHPSAIEPYQGAATGVGGIVRDIFAMGARPIAILDSLRFGPITPSSVGRGAIADAARDGGPEPQDADVTRNRYLFGGVVAGIAGYGNCLGIPTVGGEVVFEDSYSANPLVNAMCDGIRRRVSGARGHRAGDRCSEGRAPRGGHECLRRHAHRVPGTHANHRPQRPRGRCRGALRALGGPLDDHRPRVRRSSHSHYGRRRRGGHAASRYSR